MKDSHPASGPLGWLGSFRPARWLPEYRSAWLSGDAVAGVTLAAYAIPVSLAYAGLAGLPPQVGLYGYLLGGLDMRCSAHRANWRSVPPQPSHS